MNGGRVKELRRGFRETYGFNPAKTRRVLTRVRPKNFWQRAWWFITRQKPTYVAMHESIWRKWKKLAKEADRMPGPRPTNPGCNPKARAA